MSDYHRPVLEQEVADFLVRDPSAAYLDATLGGGGHTRALLARLDASGRLTSFDRDPEAVEQCRALAESDPRLTVRFAPFSRIAEYCAPETLAGALFDLIGKGVLKLSINQRYPLAEAARAHTELEAGRTIGSSVIVP